MKTAGRSDPGRPFSSAQPAQVGPGEVSAKLTKVRITAGFRQHKETSPDPIGEHFPQAERQVVQPYGSGRNLLRFGPLSDPFNLHHPPL
jgi:hypothetical protein